MCIERFRPQDQWNTDSFQNEKKTNITIKNKKNDEIIKGIISDRHTENEIMKYGHKN